MKGGDRKSKSIKELKEAGTYRKDRHANRLEMHVKPISDIPSPPEDFDTEHVEKWYKVCGGLKDLGLLQAQDLDAIEHYVRLSFVARNSLAEYLKCPIIKDRVNPAWRVYNDAMKEYGKLMDKFGFNPRARQGIKVEVEDNNDVEDPIAKILKSMAEPVRPKA